MRAAINKKALYVVLEYLSFVGDILDKINRKHCKNLVNKKTEEQTITQKQKSLKSKQIPTVLAETITSPKIRKTLSDAL